MMRMWFKKVADFLFSDKNLPNTMFAGMGIIVMLGLLGFIGSQDKNELYGKRYCGSARITVGHRSLPSLPAKNQAVRTFPGQGGVPAGGGNNFPGQPQLYIDPNGSGGGTQSSGYPVTIQMRADGLSEEVVTFWDNQYAYNAAVANQGSYMQSLCLQKSRTYKRFCFFNYSTIEDYSMVKW